VSKFKWVALAAAVVLVALLAVGATTVFAAGQKPASGKQAGPQQQQGAGNNLEAARKRIDRMITRLNGMKDRRLAGFKKIQARLDKAIETLAAKGLDVSKLKSDEEALVSKVNAASAKCDQVIAALQNAKAADSLDSLKAAAKDAMAGARELRSDMKEIRTFARTVIKADIKALRGQAGQGANPANPEPAL
jgi:phage shock protein A